MSAFGLALPLVNMHLSTDTSRFSAGMFTVRKDLQKFNRKVAESRGRLAAFGNQVDALSSRMRSLGKNMALSISVPLAIVTTMIVKTAGEFEKSMNRVRALTDATGAEFQALKDQAIELGRTTQFTARDSAGAMAYLAQAGFEVNEILGAMPSTLNLAASAQLDMATSADIVTNILAGFGKEIHELPEAVDVLVKAFTSANTNLQQLAYAMKYVGPVAAGIGFSFKETAAAVALLGNAGIQATMAGTSLRGAITRLTKPSGEAYTALKRLGISVMNSRGQMMGIVPIVREFEEAIARAGGEAAASADIMQILGARAGPGFLALVSQGSNALEELIGSFSGLSGYAQKIANIQMEGYIGALRRIQSTTEGVAITYGTHLIPAFQQVSQWIVALNTKLNELQPATRGLLIWGSIATAIVPVVVLMGGALLGAVGLMLRFKLILGITGTAMTVFTTLLAANWKDVKPILVGIWEHLSTKFREFAVSLAGESIVSSIEQFVKAVTQDISSLIDVFSTLRIPTSFKELSQQLFILGEGIRQIWRESEVPDALITGWENVRDMLSRVWDGLTTKFQEMVVSWAGEDAIDTLRRFSQRAVEIFGKLATVFGSLHITSLLTNIKQVSTAWETAESTLTRIWGNLGTRFRELAVSWAGEDVVIAVEQFVQRVIDALKRLMNAFGSLSLPASFTDMKKQIIDLGNDLKSVWKETDITSSIKNVWGEVTKATGLFDMSDSREEILATVTLLDRLKDGADGVGTSLREVRKPVMEFSEPLKSIDILADSGSLGAIGKLTSGIEQFEEAMMQARQTVIHLRDELRETGAEFQVSSFYRTPERNQQVGGNPQSSHLFGGAMDLTSSNLPQLLTQVRALNDELGNQLTIVDELNKNHIHVQIKSGTTKAKLRLLYEEIKQTYDEVQKVTQREFGEKIPMMVESGLSRAEMLFKEFDNTLVGHSIWPDMWDEVTKSTEKGLKENEVLIESHVKQYQKLFEENPAKQWEDQWPEFTKMVEKFLGPAGREGSLRLQRLLSGPFTQDEFEKYVDFHSTRNKLKRVAEEFVIPEVTQIEVNLRERLDEIEAIGEVRGGLKIGGRETYDAELENLNALIEAAEQYQKLKHQGRFDPLPYPAPERFSPLRSPSEFNLPSRTPALRGLQHTDQVGPARLGLPSLGPEAYRQGPLIQQIEKENRARIAGAERILALEKEINFQKYALETQALGIEIDTVKNNFDDVTASIRASDRVSRQFTTIGMQRYDAFDAEIRALRDSLTKLYEIEEQGRLNLGSIESDERIQRVRETRREIERLEEQLQGMQAKANFRGLFMSIADGVKLGMRQMVQGVLQGTQSVSDMFRNMIQNIIISMTSSALESAFEHLIQRLLSVSSAGGGGGGILGSLLGGAFGFLTGGPAGAVAGTATSQVGRFALPGLSPAPFARGGSIRAGQLSVVGEEGPEVFVPNSSGTIVPYGGGGRLIGSASDQMMQTTINITVKNYGKEKVSAKSRNSGPRTEEIELFIGGALANDIRRGGIVSKTIENVYGSKRVGGQRA